MPATTPRIEKIPAPIMPPIPMLRAATSPMLGLVVGIGHRLAASLRDPSSVGVEVRVVGAKQPPGG